MKGAHVAAVVAVIAAATAPAPASAEKLVVDRDLIDDAIAMLLDEADSALLGRVESAPASTEKKRSRASAAPAATTASGASGFGIGLQVGTPTAITLKLDAGGGAGIVLGLGTGYAFRGDGFGLSIHGDYLMTVAPLLSGGAVNIDAYVGPGLWLTVFSGGYGFGGGFYYARNDFLGLGVRFPIGLNAKFAAAPVEVYLELDPALFVFPGLDIFIGASLGFRWFF